MVKSFKKIAISLAIPTISIAATAQSLVMRTDSERLTIYENGKPTNSPWFINKSINPDTYTTFADQVEFKSGIDSICFNLDREWDQKDFVVINEAGDSAFTRIVRMPADPFMHPAPQLTNRRPGSRLDREQAEFDIDALVYAISQTHPNMFAVCTQNDFFHAVNEAKKTLPDSLSTPELYGIAARLTAMLGDGHTSVAIPYNDVFTAESRRLPLEVKVRPDRRLTARWCIDSIIPDDAEILSIGGRSADEILDAMLPFESGEKEHFRLSRLNNDFSALFEILYAAPSHEVEFRRTGSDIVEKATLPAATYDEIIAQIPKNRNRKTPKLYSFTVDSINNVVVMDFRRFYDPEKMEQFADSLFRTLHDKKIDNLIIDVRNNGGGNSYVGDIILRYITPVPFTQMEKALIRVTPFSAKLMNNESIPQWYFYETTSEENLLKPRTPEELHYDGNVYLLTSNHTFSSASSFSWAFKECGIGPVIGEETGGMNVSFGDVLAYRLPVSGLYCGISYKRFWQFHADETDIHGVIPDIAVAKEDALDKAMEIIKKKNSTQK